MKIKKNGKVVNLTESDLQRIVKKVLNEAKVSLSSCNKNNIFEWLRSDSSEIGAAATQLANSNSKKLKRMTGALANAFKSEKKETHKILANCEGLMSSDFDAGVFSNISDKGNKDNAIKNTVQKCRQHLDSVSRDLQSGKHNKIKKHIKNSFQPNDNKNIDVWIKEKNGDFSNEINQIKVTSKCLYNTYF